MKHKFLNFDYSLKTMTQQRCPVFGARRGIAIVRVFVAPRTVDQIERTARVTFSDQLASLGKCTNLTS